MSNEQELYHGGAKCSECGERVGVPHVLEGRAPDVVPPGCRVQNLFCASCSRAWVERDPHEIARAWFAHGAHEQHVREENVREQGKREAIIALHDRYGVPHTMPFEAWLDQVLTTAVRRVTGTGAQSRAQGLREAVAGIARFIRAAGDRACLDCLCHDNMADAIEAGAWKESFSGIDRGVDTERLADARVPQDMPGPDLVGIARQEWEKTDDER